MQQRMQLCNEWGRKKRKDGWLSKVLNDRKLGGTDRGRHSRHIFLPGFYSKDCQQNAKQEEEGTDNIGGAGCGVLQGRARPDGQQHDIRNDR